MSEDMSQNPNYDAEEASGYKYDILPTPDSIRLLHLEPGKGDDAVHCSLSTHKIADAPPYEAVSYVWGDAQDRRVIFCSRQVLQVTVNLRDALRRIRSASCVKVLWVDAICINQDDVEERGQQVTLMGSIFSEAQRVLVYLGPDDGDAQHVFALIHETNCSFRLQEKLPYSKIPSLRTEDLASCNASAWKSLSEPLENEYFKRCWTLQEIGLARQALVLYGAAQIQWFAFVEFLSWMCHKGAVFQTHFKLGDVTRIYQSFLAFADSEMRARYAKSWEPDFLEVLLETRHRRSSDPRDHIYAFLGHPAARTNNGLILRPDYTKTPAQVCYDFAVKWLNQAQDLLMLSAVFWVVPLEDRREQVTWVPRWDKDFDCASIILGNNTIYYDASAESSSFFFIGICERSLWLNGLVVDRVSCSSHNLLDKYFLSDSLLPEGATRIHDLEMLCHAVSLTDSPARYDDRVLALSFTLVAGLFGTYPAEAHLEQHRANFAAYRACIHENNRNSYRDYSVNTDINLEELRGAAEGGVFQQYIFGSHSWCHNRSFFISAQGYYGLGPGFLEVGDVCCILFGARVPFILRLCGNKYLLVGEAYIHGLMRGEAMEMWKQGELEMVNFEIV